MTGMSMILVGLLLLILVGLRKVRTVFCAVVLGSAMAGVSVPLSVTGTIPVVATASLAFAWPEVIEPVSGMEGCRFSALPYAVERVGQR